MATYDDAALQQYADNLDRQARWIVFPTALQYSLIAFLFSALVTFVAIRISPAAATPATAKLWLAFLVVFTAVGALAGVTVGRYKSFQLKLQVQQILCQRQIEMNTRLGAGSVKSSN